MNKVARLKLEHEAGSQPDDMKYLDNRSYARCINGPLNRRAFAQSLEDIEK